MNKRYFKGVAASAVMAAAVATLATTAQAASTDKPAQPAGKSTPPEAASALAAITKAYRTAGLTQAQALRAAAGGDARRALQDALVKSPTTFGGSWFDARTNTLHVAETTAAARRFAAAKGASLGVKVITHAVTRSYAQLQAQADDLRRSRTGLGRIANGNVGIDVVTNSVTAAVPASLVSARSTQPGTAGVRLVAKAAKSGQEDAACSSRAACDYTIRAGNILWRGANKTPWCSVGFTARQTNNARWVYTAGHCSQGNGEVWGTGARPIGTMYASVNTGAYDVSLIRVTNPWFASDQGGEIYNTVYVNGVAPSVGYMMPGETVCLSANFTQPSGGNFCGILATSSDANNRGLAKVNGLDACPGDSGGGWYWLTSSGRRYAYGLHSRSDLGCHGDQGGSASWFTPIANAKAWAPWLTVETRP